MHFGRHSLSTLCLFALIFFSFSFFPLVDNWPVRMNMSVKRTKTQLDWNIQTQTGVTQHTNHSFSLLLSLFFFTHMNSLFCLQSQPLLNIRLYSTWGVALWEKDYLIQIFNSWIFEEMEVILLWIHSRCDENGFQSFMAQYYTEIIFTECATCEFFTFWAQTLGRLANKTIHDIP